MRYVGQFEAPFDALNSRVFRSHIDLFAVNDGFSHLPTWSFLHSKRSMYLYSLRLGVAETNVSGLSVSAEILSVLKLRHPEPSPLPDLE
jgi:hypothetical protein